MVSKKVAADISHFMKLAKAKYGTDTESQALRIVLAKHEPEMFKQAQEIAEQYGLLEEPTEGNEVKKD